MTDFSNKVSAGPSADSLRLGIQAMKDWDGTITPAPEYVIEDGRLCEYRIVNGERVLTARL